MQTAHILSHNSLIDTPHALVPHSGRQRTARALRSSQACSHCDLVLPEEGCVCGAPSVNQGCARTSAREKRRFRSGCSMPSSSSQLACDTQVGRVNWAFTMRGKMAFSLFCCVTSSPPAAAWKGNCPAAEPRPIQHGRTAECMRPLPSWCCRKRLASQLAVCKDWWDVIRRQERQARTQRQCPCMQKAHLLLLTTASMQNASSREASRQHGQAHATDVHNSNKRGAQPQPKPPAAAAHRST